MILGYNTNGLAHHRPLDGLQLLAEIGYRSVAITVDHGWFATQQNINEVSGFLTDHGLTNVIETGARFLLDPRIKHHPTLLDADPKAAARRIDFLKRCINIAAQLNSDCVSIWSGTKHPLQSPDEAFDQLVKNLGTVLEHAESCGIDIGFEPEPGMLIDTSSSFSRLLEHIDSQRMKMTLDIGHLHCLGETPLPAFIERWGDRIVNIHIEDMIHGVHDHLMFGDGEIEFLPVIQALHKIGYKQGVHVELSRHSHNAAEIARRSFEFLRPLIDQVS